VGCPEGPANPLTAEPPTRSRIFCTTPPYELITAGMLILAGGGDGTPLDYNELERWTRVGYERGMRSPNGER
jgi:hypothetical protein